MAAECPGRKPGDQPPIKSQSPLERATELGTEPLAVASGYYYTQRHPLATASGFDTPAIRLGNCLPPLRG